MSEDEDVETSVRAHGWHCIAVEESMDEPGFAYTIGLGATFQHPEIVVVGLPRDVAHQLLADIANDLKKGIRCSPEKARDDLLEGLSVAFREVHHTQIEARMGGAMAFYRKARLALTALQLFWPDKQGRFPFEPGCDFKVCLLQSRLDIPRLTS